MSTTPNNGVREYRIPAVTDHIRTFKNPNNNEIKITHAYVKVSDFPHSKISDEINPRKHEKLDGPIPKRISESLLENPEYFHLLNRGLLIISQDTIYDNKSGILHITINSPQEGGLADGATTDRQLAKIKREVSNVDFESLTQAEIPEHLKNSYIHLEIISGVPSEFLIPLTAARNTSRQVAEFALLELGGEYEKLKNVLEDSQFKGMIRYKENDIQPVDVRTVLGILTLFHPKWNEINKEPTVAYSSKGAVLDYYKDPEWKKGYEVIAPLAPDILALHNYIHKTFPDRYQQYYGKGSKIGARVEIKYRDGTLIASHPLLGEKVKYGIPDGWIYPLLAGFRELVEYPTGRSAIKWKTNPERFFDKHGAELVFFIVDLSEQVMRNPNSFGKSRPLWRTLRSTISGLLASDNR